MPTARNGEWRSQAFIAFCVGARHWSKPYPVKLPGVATLAAWAGALTLRVASMAARPVTTLTTAVRVVRRTGRDMAISWGSRVDLRRGPVTIATEVTPVTAVRITTDL